MYFPPLVVWLILTYDFIEDSFGGTDEFCAALLTYSIPEQRENLFFFSCSYLLFNFTSCKSRQYISFFSSPHVRKLPKAMF